MSRTLKAVSVTGVLTISVFSVLVLISPNVVAFSNTWTTDSQFNAPGAIFTNTEVVGSGPAASVELLKDFTDWKDLNPSSPPVAREGPGAAFSTYNNRTVLFGGYNSSFLSELADTWEYDYQTNTWTEFYPNPHPMGREYARLSYDPLQKVVVLFGGVNGTAPDTYLGDTWEYSVVTRSWTETVPAGPLMLYSAMTYDAGAKRHIMVGWNYTNNNFQTWAYDAGADKWTLRVTGGVNPARTGHAIAYDAQLQRTVLFGGFDASVPPGVSLGDTWEYNNATNSWAQIAITGPSARQAHSMTYRPAAMSVYLFGGRSDSGAMADTWRYLSNRSWELIGVSTSPPPRQAMAFVYDTNADVGILYGGRDSSFRPLGDTWSLEASYRSAGKYQSAPFDSGCGNVDWQTLWWNKSSQPPNTFLRFQLATANTSAGPWTYIGPGGSGSAYYLAPPAAIYSGHDNQRYLRFMGDFGSFDTHATPSLEDLTIEYACPPAPPYIVSTDPINLGRNVPLLWAINVTFSEAMNPLTVQATFLAGDAVPLTAHWYSGNTMLNLSHTQPFTENMAYRIQITGKDMDGLDLVKNPIDSRVVNPWYFFTLTTYPYVTKTNPAMGDPSVPLAADIIVDFSEPMDTQSVNWTIDPILSLSSSWSNGDARLTLSHATPFRQCIPYTMHITNGTDKVGVPLIPGVIPNPWTFTTFCNNPYIVEVYPLHFSFDVPLASAIYVNFSEPMNTGSVSWTLLQGAPLTFTPSWSDSNRRLKITHTPNFPTCQPYKIKIVGKDLDGNDLLPGPFPSSPPNPWSFMTLCNNPFVMMTLPENGTTNVPLGTSIVIAFDEQMINSTVVVSITPPVVEVERQWNYNMMLTIVHLGFTECTKYTVNVVHGHNAANYDLVPGFVPNPFVFDTICVSPYVVSTDPAHGEALVPLNHDITITFSKPMNESSILFVLTPDVTPKSLQWSNNSQILTITHSTDFLESTTYEAFVDGLGADGRNLLVPGPSVPDPWNFTTRPPGFYIVSTDPSDKSVDVPVDKSVVVTFSAPASRTSLIVTSIPTMSFSPSWSNLDQTVTLGHATPFIDCTNYTITVNATDTGSNPLTTVPGSAPNPWKFKTACAPPLGAPGGLQVTRSPPSDILLNWRPVTGATTYVVYSATSKFAPWPWPQLGEVATTTYRAANHLNDSAQHFYIVKAKSGTTLSGNSTMGAKVPITFTFNPGKGNIHWLSLPYRTAYRKASDISGELTSSLITVVAKWNPGSQSPILWYYFRNKWRGTDFNINPGDGIYIGVRTAFTWIIVGTDGPVQLSFNWNPTRGNLNWISLPYTSTYANAHDVVMDIEGSIGPGAHNKIDEVAKWDVATQTIIKYSWGASGWSGDFAIAPGEGIYLRIIANFQWTPDLITPEVP